MSDTKFIPGLELGRRFYFDAVRPILDADFPDLPHAAAQIGTGSDVLGFDNATSTDHDWSPSVMVFLTETDWPRYAKSIQQVMGEKLPFDFMGYPVHSVQAPGEDEGTRIMAATRQRPIHHSVWAVTVSKVFQHHLGWNIGEQLHIVDWLTIPSQLLRGFTAGAVHFDNVGELTRIREQLRWYPQDVWLYLLAAAWLRIEASEPLVGRTGDVGDELGSSLIGARLVHEVMRLCFLMERQYAPYAKWFGSAFKQLNCASELTPWLLKVQYSTHWKDRENALVQVYQIVAAMHNQLGITDPLPEVPSVFRHSRPYLVLHGDRFAKAILNRISDETIKPLLEGSIIGGIDQWLDHDDLRMMIADWRPRLISIYT